jgi:hypothetical protein
MSRKHQFRTRAQFSRWTNLRCGRTLCQDVSCAHHNLCVWHTNRSGVTFKRCSLFGRENGTIARLCSTHAQYQCHPSSQRTHTHTHTHTHAQKVRHTRVEKSIKNCVWQLTPIPNVSDVSSLASLTNCICSVSVRLTGSSANLSIATTSHSGLAYTNTCFCKSTTNAVLGLLVAV